MQIPPTTAANEADKAISAIVDTLKAQYPDLGLSYGYIGNVDRFGDDRDFRIFTNRCAADFSYMSRSISFHLGGFLSLPGALERLQAGAFESFAKQALRCPRHH